MKYITHRETIITYNNHISRHFLVHPSMSAFIVSILQASPSFVFFLFLYLYNLFSFYCFIQSDLIHSWWHSALFILHQLSCQLMSVINSPAWAGFSFITLTETPNLLLSLLLAMAYHLFAYNERTSTFLSMSIQFNINQSAEIDSQHAVTPAALFVISHSVQLTQLACVMYILSYITNMYKPADRL